jgi:hypothetical protein
VAASTWAGVISAIAGTITAVGGLFLALAVFIPAQRANKATLDDVHKIVNQQRTDMTNFNRALIRALVDAGVQVPVDQSLAAEGTPAGPDPATRASEPLRDGHA